MIRTGWVLLAAAAVILWTGTGSGRAGDDTLKLDLKKGREAATTNLLGSDADTVQVKGGGHGGGHGHGGHAHGGHGHGGHFHGGHVNSGHFHGGHVHAGHFHGGHFHNGHFHNGHFHNGHFHNGHFHNGAFVSLGLGLGYWPSYYYPYYDPYYYPSYYSSSYVYDPLVYSYPSAVYVGPSVYSTPAYSYPNGNGLSNGSGTLPTPGRSVMPRATEPEELMPVPRPTPKNGTYQYDGGPANPVPMPQADPAPGRKAGSMPTPDTRVVRTESKPPKYSYQAYGDKPAARKVGEDRQLAARPAK